MAPEILLPSIQHKIGFGSVAKIRRCNGWFLPVGIRLYLSGFRLCILLQHPAGYPPPPALFLTVRHLCTWVCWHTCWYAAALVRFCMGIGVHVWVSILSPV